MLTWARKTAKVKIAELLVCFEHTGIYGMELAAFLEKKNVFYCMVPALEIKRSLGMVRGKNDRVDAIRIAEYAHLRRDTIKETKLPSALLQKMKKLIGLRSKMVGQRAGYMASVGELKRIYKKTDHSHLFSIEEKMIKELTKSIDIVEAELKVLINGDEEVKRTFNLLLSIKGIGPIAAYNLIVVTRCFHAF
ncbi:MAG: transposase [Roseivirga sp.]|jgi:transposase